MAKVPAGADEPPVKFEIQAAGTRLKLTTDVALPITRKSMSFQMDLKGEMLNSLDHLK